MVSQCLHQRANLNFGLMDKHLINESHHTTRKHCIEHPPPLMPPNADIGFLCVAVLAVHRAFFLAIKFRELDPTKNGCAQSPGQVLVLTADPGLAAKSASAWERLLTLQRLGEDLAACQGRAYLWSFSLPSIKTVLAQSSGSEPVQIAACPRANLPRKYCWNTGKWHSTIDSSTDKHGRPGHRMMSNGGSTYPSERHSARQQKTMYHCQAMCK